MSTNPYLRNAVVAGVIAFVVVLVIALASGDGAGTGVLHGAYYLVGVTIVVLLGQLLVQTVRRSRR